MESVKRSEKRFSHRIKSDRDSGYEDLSPISRPSCSFEDVQVTPLPPSFTDWSIPAMMQQPGKITAEMLRKTTSAKRRFVDENRKNEVEAGKIGISHMLRHFDSKSQNKELPNLKPAIKASTDLLEASEEQIPSRKPRRKRRSKSADGRPVRQISMFNPVYTKILTPRELEERRKWTEKLRLDALLDEEYYKLPYEEINMEIALGRYSRSEPRLNWKRKQRKRVSFSTDIEQREEKRTEAKAEGEYNWKEDSGFHEMDMQPVKSIVKNNPIQGDSFDDSNVFSDETSSDSHSSESTDECESGEKLPLESELQGLCHLIKTQEERTSNVEPQEKEYPKIESNYITELVLNLKTPPIPKTKTRKIFPADLQRSIHTSDKHSTQLTSHISDSPNSGDGRNTAPQNTVDSQKNKNSANVLAAKDTAIAITNYGNDSPAGNSTVLIDNSIPSKNKKDLKRVTVLIHTAGDALEEPSDNAQANHELASADNINGTSSRLRINDISEESTMPHGIFEGNVEAKRNIFSRNETAIENTPEVREKASNKFFEITPPVKTLPDIQWHRDFIDYNEQSPLKQSAEGKGNQPLKVKALIGNVGGRIKSPLSQSNFSKLNGHIQATEKNSQNPISATKPLKTNVNIQKLPTTTYQSSRVKTTPCQPKSLKIDTIDKNNKAPLNSAKNGKEVGTVKLPSSLLHLNNDRTTHGHAKIVSNAHKIADNRNRDTSPPNLKKGDPCRKDGINAITENDQNAKKDILNKQQLISVMGKEKLKFLNILESDEDGSVENNNNTMEKVPMVVESYTVAKPSKAVSVLVNKCGHVTDLDSISGNESIKDFNQNNVGTRIVPNIEDIDRTVFINNEDQNSKCNPDISKIIKNKLILEDDFYCETDTSDEAMLAEISEGNEVESEDLIQAVTSVDTSYNKAQENNKDSVVYSISETKPNLGEQHRQNEMDGQTISVSENNIATASVKWPVNKNVDSIATSVKNVPLLTLPEERSKIVEIKHKEKNNELLITPLPNKVPCHKQNNNISLTKYSGDILPQSNSIDYKPNTINGLSDLLQSSLLQTTSPLGSRKSGSESSETFESESSEEEISDSSADSNASYNVEQETHEVSIKDSPNEAKRSVNEHHEYFKEEGQAAKSTDIDGATVKSIVRRKVEETVTDVINVTSVILPDEIKNSNGIAETEKMKKPVAENIINNKMKSENAKSKFDRLNPETPDTRSKVSNSQLRSNSDNSKTQHSPTLLKTPPFALPRTSLSNGVTDKKEQTLGKTINHNINTKDAGSIRNTKIPTINKNNEKRMDNMAKIKEAFIKAGLNPNVLDDLENFDRQTTLSPSDFRENFVNMFLTKELDFTDYNIHLRTRTNSGTPNYTVTRKYLPLSIINEQMTWLRHSPEEKPVYTCHIASSNENIHKAALSLTKGSRSGTNSPEECYEYNDRDESPIDNQTTSPTPSWAESSSSGCFSASCSPTPLPTSGRPVPMPTSL